MSSSSPEITEQAIRDALLTAVPFNQHLAIEVLQAQPGRGVVRLPDAEFLRNHVGTQHAGALFLAGEAAGGAAFIGAFAADMGRITFLMRAAEISYEKLATGAILATCDIRDELPGVRAELERSGKTRLTAAATLRNEAGDEVAALQLTYSVRQAPASEA